MLVDVDVQCFGSVWGDVVREFHHLYFESGFLRDFSGFRHNRGVRPRCGPHLHFLRGFVTAPRQYQRHRSYNELPHASPSERHVVVPKNVITLPMRRCLRRRTRLSCVLFVDIPEPLLHRSLPTFRRVRDVFYEAFGIESHFFGNANIFFIQATEFLRLFPKFRIVRHDVCRIGRYKKIPRAKPDRILSEDLAGVVGFEPTSGGFRIRCLNRTWRYPSPDMVRSERLELSCLSPQPPQGCASTNFATTASGTSNFNLRRRCRDLPHLRRCAF